MASHQDGQENGITHDITLFYSLRCCTISRLRLAILTVVLVSGVTNIMIAELSIKSSNPVSLRTALRSCSFGIRSHNAKAKNATHAITISSTPINIPPNFITNTKFGVHTEPSIIQDNILHNMHYFPKWNVISDNDDSCLRKIQQTPVFHDSFSIAPWFRNQSTPGMYKSDACRLAQLYLHGGIYLDNDLHLTSSLMELFESGPEIISSVNVGGRKIFQAILSAPPGHLLIRRSIEIMTSLIERQDFTRNIGPISLRLAMNEVYNISGGRINRTQMFQKGVLLLQEKVLNSNHPLMKNRTSMGFCNIVLAGLDGKVYGFSRVKNWGSSSEKSCEGR